MNRFFWHLSIALALISMLSCSDNSPLVVRDQVVRPVKQMTIDLLSTKRHDFPGEVKASKQAFLGFRVAGEILKYHVRSGQQIKRGQLLAELDPIEYYLVAKAQQANYDLALVQHQRSTILVKDYIISREDFDRSHSAFKVAQSEFNTAQANLSYTKFYAPYDGVVASTYMQNYEYAIAQQPILSFQSVNAIDIEVAVPERLIAALQNQARLGGSNPQVSFSVNPKATYLATFKNIETVVDSDTGSYTVTLTMAQPNEITLYPGMSAMVSATLRLDDHELNSTIPASAIIREGSRVFVWRVSLKQTLEKAYIELSANNMLVTGLNDGDIIVAAGANELTEGQRVKKWLKERGL